MINFKDALDGAEPFMVSFTDENNKYCESSGYFTNGRVDRNTVPKNWFVYDIRDDGHGKICTLENHVGVNHYGCFITQTPVVFSHNDYHDLKDNYTFE